MAQIPAPPAPSTTTAINAITIPFPLFVLVSGMPGIPQKDKLIISVYLKAKKQATQKMACDNHTVL
jgi:hypothetical protein